MKGNLVMAEVKRDLIEHIFDVDKDNGQTIQLNIMKWGRNSQKYDLRIWNEEKPLKGFNLSDQELKRLVVEIEKKYGKKENAEPKVKEQFQVEEVKEIDLKSILEKFPECENDNSRLRAVLRDFYPKDSREVNVADNSKKKTTGMKTDSNQKKKPIVKKGMFFGYGEQVFEDSCASASYQGIYKFNGMFAQGMRIRFFFENKTKKDMRVEVKNITVNGLVLESSDLFNSCVEAGRRVVDTVLVYKHNMEAAGVKSLKGVKSISVQFQYEIDGKKYRTEDCDLMPLSLTV